LLGRSFKKRMNLCALSHLVVFLNCNTIFQMHDLYFEGP